MNLHDITPPRPRDYDLLMSYFEARYTAFEWRAGEGRNFEYRDAGLRTALWSTLHWSEAQNTYLDRAIEFRRTGRIM